ncbi:MAG TPA: acyltransferase [Acidimicrobiales bacterium]|nr:acyltransferase [Acidimicrobiales bacterium]
MNRRPDIDNLRSAACFLLLAFHTAMIFDYTPAYHVKNAASFQGFDVFALFVHQWHMPLFFVLAGWSMAAALKRRTPEEVRNERWRRLGIPLLVFGLTECVFIGWIEVRHAHDRTVAANGSPVHIGGVAVTWSHLWFLAYLLTFALLYLPHFAKANARRDEPVVTRRSFVRFVGLMIAIQVLLRWAWPGQQTLVWDWANFAYYSAFFIGGFYVGRFESVDRLVDEHRVVMLRIGLAAELLMLPFFLRVVVVNDASDWLAYLVEMTLSAVAGVGMVIGILGWARRSFTGSGRLHAWARDRAFGVYLVHQGFVVGLGALVIAASWPIAVKFAVTLVTATAATLVVNEALQRIDWLAPAFGRDRAATRRRGAPRTTALPG